MSDATPLPSGIVLPRGVRLVDPAALEPVPEVGPPCAKCGQPLPPLDEESKRILAANGGIATLAHEVCPDAVPAAPGRYFECRVTIVEVTEEQGGSSLGPDVAPTITTDELVSFRVGGRYDDLDSAMRPLAEQLGGKWLEAEKKAKIADGTAS